MRTASAHDQYNPPSRINYTLYRVPHSFGEYNADLTNGIKRVAQQSENVRFTVHAEAEMANDSFDHDDVMTALRRGSAYGPELRNGRLVANVVHRGLNVRVSVGGLDGVDEDWTRLRGLKVVTVMKV